MKRVVPSLILVMIAVFVPTTFVSAIQRPILITEVQTGSANSASEEFVEIYNTTNQDLDISGWGLYYKSAAGSSWSKKATVTDGSKLQGDEFWTFVANIEGDTQYSSGLSQSGGSVQLRDGSGNVMDQFGWGSANAPLGVSASESQQGQSMYRLYDFSISLMQSSDNNFNDFDITNTPTPGTFPAQEVVEEDQLVQNYPKLQLSEVFPDPASPQTDSVDEFIEIYNPNGFAVDLAGWKLSDEGGAEFIIKGMAVDPNGRSAFFVTDTKITLNNSGDSVRLIDPNGQVVDESINYGVAEEGLSWINSSGSWQWAVEATPNASNATIYIDTSAAGSVESVKKATTKKKAAAKKSTAKPKANKLKSTTANSAGSQPTLEAKESQSQSSQWWSWLLVGIGAVTIGYGFYEYRTEIHIFFKKLGAKLGIRGKVS